MNHNIWSLLVNIVSFLDIETFPQKKKIRPTLMLIKINNIYFDLQRRGKIDSNEKINLILKVFFPIDLEKIKLIILITLKLCDCVWGTGHPSTVPYAQISCRRSP